MTDSPQIRSRTFALWVSRSYLIVALATSLQLGDLTFAPVSYATSPSSEWADSTFPTINGTGNNLGDPQMNVASTMLERLIPADYSDGANGRERPAIRS